MTSMERIEPTECRRLAAEYRIGEHDELADALDRAAATIEFEQRRAAAAGADERDAKAAEASAELVGTHGWPVSN